MADYTLSVRIDKEKMIADYLNAMKAVKDKANSDEQISKFKIVADEKTFFDSIKKLLSGTSILEKDIKIGIDQSYYKNSLNKLENYTGKSVTQIRNSLGRGFSDLEKYDLNKVIEGNLSSNKVKNKVKELSNDIKSSMQVVDVNDFRQVDTLLEKVRMLQSITEQISTKGKHNKYSDIFDRDLSKSSIEDLISNVKMQYSQAMVINRDNYITQIKNQMQLELEGIQKNFQTILNTLFDEFGKIRNVVSDNISSGITEGVDDGKKALQELESQADKVSQKIAELRNNKKNNSNVSDDFYDKYFALSDKFEDDESEINQKEITDFVNSTKKYIATLDKSSEEYKNVVNSYNDVIENLGSEGDGAKLPMISNMKTFTDLLNEAQVEQNKLNHKIAEQQKIQQINQAPKASDLIDSDNKLELLEQETKIHKENEQATRSDAEAQKEFNEANSVVPIQQQTDAILSEAKAQEELNKQKSDEPIVNKALDSSEESVSSTKALSEAEQKEAESANEAAQAEISLAEAREKSQDTVNDTIPTKKSVEKDNDGISYINDTTEEIQNLELLRVKINEVKQAIADKTNEFKNEADAVDGYVASEQESLGGLINTLNNIDQQIKTTIDILQNSNNKEIIFTPKLADGYADEIQKILQSKIFKIKLSPELSSSFVKTAQNKLDEIGGLKIKSFEEEKALNIASSDFLDRFIGGFDVSKKTAEELKSEIKSIITLIQTGGKADSGELFNILGGDEKYLRQRYSVVWDEFNEIRKFVNNSKIKVSDEDISEFGENWKNVHGKIGVNVISRTEGVDAETFLKELHEHFGTITSDVTSTQEALRVLYEYLDNPPNLQELFFSEKNQEEIKFTNDELTSLANKLDIQKNYYNKSISDYKEYLDNLQELSSQEKEILNNVGQSFPNINKNKDSNAINTVDLEKEFERFLTSSNDWNWDMMGEYQTWPLPDIHTDELIETTRKNMELVKKTLIEEGYDIHKISSDWFSSLMSGGSTYGGGIWDLDNIKNHLNELKSNISSNTIGEAFQQDQTIVSNVIETERQLLQALIEKIQEVINEIEKKNRAFKEEGQIVDGVVQNEINSLNTLFGSLSTLREEISSIKNNFDNVDLKVNINDDSKNVTKFISSLSKVSNDKIDTKLVSIFSSLDDFVKDINSLQIKDDNILSSINSILQKTKELENLSSILKNTKNKIREVKKVIPQEESGSSAEISNVDKAVEIYNRLYNARTKLANNKEGTNEPLVQYWTSEIAKAEQEIKELILTEEEASQVSDLVAKKEVDAANAVFEAERKKAEAIEKSDIKLQNNIKTAEREQVQVTKLATGMMKNGKLMNEYGDRVKDILVRIKQIDTSVEPTEAISQLKQLKNELISIKSAAEEAGKSGQTFGQMLSQRFKSLGAYLATFVQFYDIIRYIRQAYSNVVQLDSAMIELAKVSEQSFDQIKSDFQDYANTAKDLGATITDTISATADWARLGYNVPDAKELARVALLYKNVGDGIDIDAANQSLISTLQGYQMQADEAEHIVDVFNEVANNYAIDTAGIGEALQRSAASLNAANTSLEQSVALVTAANTVVQNPESVGTTFKTLSARIRGSKTDLEELGEEADEFTETTSKLQGLVKSLTGFDILEADQKTYKSIYDILIGIGKEWKNLDDIEQASLGEALAGKRNANTLFAILDNIDTLESAYETAENSAGSAMREQENFEQGLEYSTNRMKASLEELSSDFLNSDFLKGLIDTGTKFIEILDKIISHFGTLQTLLIGIGTVVGSKKLG